ncbi:acyl-CoA dehydrogenase family protein [Sphingopyxis lindanitolerans]|nr:acyl-CoA dehydrogenase family protein [Sphingopyxis lindanitolerans]
MDAKETRALDSWDRSRALFEIAGASLAPLVAGDDRQAAHLEWIFLLLLAADSLGGSEAILAQTINYMKIREQFGQPIGSFQALKHRAANLSADIVTSARIAEQAIDSHDAVAGFWSRLAKAAVSETFVRTAGEAVQLHGGIGYTWEHGCHLYLKRARLNEALCRSNSALRDAAASDLIGLLATGVDVMEIAA